MIWINDLVQAGWCGDHDAPLMGGSNHPDHTVRARRGLQDYPRWRNPNARQPDVLVVALF
jgi:hypothetical protein